ncbi:MAG TPA: energy transducer TonB, partial [Thermoanaerobaculia bacterium]|nr:energy transducer TonB [Thermoanaerobaculia bacterium]
MQIPEEFGNYLLLKKLSEDPLGETFRAGKLGQEGIEQVVLLRVLNGKGMDGERLWQKISGRAALQQSLKSPNIGSGVDLGRVRNFPYTAYDYVSGKNLAALLAQADKQGSPVPADHAMLIAERVSLALAVAYESRLQDERVLHGYVVPHLVMVSNEGETRLLGFEVAPGLRDLAAGGFHHPELDPYLAPETFDGTPVGRADDVWSLGALLFELLTGSRLPAGIAPDGYGPAIDAATVANDGAPFPAAVAALLKKSLAPRDQRIADAVTWHKSISKLMIDGHYSPTTFNLAFFMHNLFREEIERESREMQAEKKLAVTGRAAVAPAAAAGAATLAIPRAAVAAATGASAGAAAADFREKTGVREVTHPGVAPGAGGFAGVGVSAAPEGSRKGLWIGLAAVLLAAALGGGWFFYLRPAPKPAPPLKAVAPPVAAPAPLGTEAAVPAGPKPEEIQAQIAAMFDARSKEMEAKLKGQYDDRIKALQKQLEDSKKAGAAPPEEKSHSGSTAATPPSAPPSEVKPAPRPEPPAASSEAAGSPAPPSPGAGGGSTASANPAAAVPPPSRTVPSSAVPAAPKEPQVQAGDLVTFGPGVVRPQVAGMPEPRYPAAARRMRKEAKVDLKVLVDERGNVVQAELAGDHVGFGFDEAAVE